MKAVTLSEIVISKSLCKYAIYGIFIICCHVIEDYRSENVLKLHIACFNITDLPFDEVFSCFTKYNVFIFCSVVFKFRLSESFFFPDSDAFPIF